MATSQELLAKYREIQSLEGATWESELAIARAQGEAWRQYVEALEQEEKDEHISDYAD